MCVEKHKKYIINQNSSILMTTYFKEGFLKKYEKKLVQSFNFMFHYIDDIISINNSKLGDFGDRIYPIEFEIKDITDTAMNLSYVDLHHGCPPVDKS
jgi:hypothetical protein